MGCATCSIRGSDEMLVEINATCSHPVSHQRTGLSDAVRNVSLTLGQEKLGIVGESGSGKSLTARSILRLLPSNADRRPPTN